MSAPDANGWRPIESAPKDGRCVDLWVDGNRFVDCFWYEAFKTWAYRHGYPQQTCVMRSAAATHWQPLPKPPVQTTPPRNAS